jgi:hypothetical protein
MEQFSFDALAFSGDVDIGLKHGRCGCDPRELFQDALILSRR